MSFYEEIENLLKITKVEGAWRYLPRGFDKDNGSRRLPSTLFRVSMIPRRQFLFLFSRRKDTVEYILAQSVGSCEKAGADRNTRVYRQQQQKRRKRDIVKIQPFPTRGYGWRRALNCTSTTLPFCFHSSSAAFYHWNAAKWKYFANGIAVYHSTVAAAARNFYCACQRPCCYTSNTS